MTTIEKKFAEDSIFTEKVMQILPAFTGLDYKEAKDILDGVHYCLIRNAVFDYEDSKVALKDYLRNLGGD